MNKIKASTFVILASVLALGSTLYTTDKQHASADVMNPNEVQLVSLKKVAESGNVTYAPDNSSYLLQKGIDLYVVQNGQEKKLASNVAKAAWKQDGKGVFFSEVQNENDLSVESGIFETDVNGIEKTQVGTTNKPYRFFRDKNDQVIAEKNKELHTTNLFKKTVTAMNSFEADDFRVSPDGEWVVVLKETHLSLINTKNGQKTMLADAVDWHQLADFAWSDDSTQLAYATHTTTHDEALFVFDVTTKKAKQVYAVREYLFVGVNWLKNGNLLYELLPTHSSNSQEGAIYETIPAKVNAQPTILFRNGLGVRLSDDGKKVTFVRDSDPTGVTNGAFVAELKY